ncbi:uncharacterized protein [Cicer arietinum]|uniref:uncharacterized protein n=1 Tax=Cicer arietinum TaxID=3827 RepID=UPI003CC657D3
MGTNLAKEILLSRSRAQKEFETDFNSMDTTISCGSNFQGEYTNAKIKEVQIRSKMNCVASLYTVEGFFATYYVLEEVSIGDRPRGIFCRHVLFVCTQERVKNVAEKYILTRWKKNIKRKHSYIKSNYDVKELKPQIDMFDKLCKHFYEVVAVSEDGTKALHEILYQFNSNEPTMDTTNNNVKRSYIDTSSPNNDNEIRSPLRIKRKSRPPSKRKRFIVEKVGKRLRNRTNQRNDRESTIESHTKIVRNQNESKST